MDSVRLLAGAGAALSLAGECGLTAVEQARQQNHARVAAFLTVAEAAAAAAAVEGASSMTMYEHVGC